MEPAFWHERWQANEIGFHQNEIHVYLQDFWPRLELHGAERVFVPLCGKSNDILWLLEQGHPVVGVELSSVAVEAFFRENRLDVEKTTLGKFTRWHFAELEILCGDFFELTPALLGEVPAVYDRASLIALPPEMRRRYVEHLTGLLTPGTRILLITLEYPQTDMQGPPFSVEESEVFALYRHGFSAQPLCAKDILAQEPRFQAKGVSRLHERAYWLERRA